MVRRRVLVLQCELKFRWSDLAPAVPVLLGPLLLEELFVLLLSLDVVLEFCGLLLLILVLLDEAAVLLFDCGNLVHIRLQVRGQLLREQLVHVVLQVC